MAARASTSCARGSRRRTTSAVRSCLILSMVRAFGWYGAAAAWRPRRRARRPRTASNHSLGLGRVGGGAGQVAGPGRPRQRLLEAARRSANGRSTYDSSPSASRSKATKPAGVFSASMSHPRLGRVDPLLQHLELQPRRRSRRTARRRARTARAAARGRRRRSRGSSGSAAWCCGWSARPRRRRGRRGTGTRPTSARSSARRLPRVRHPSPTWPASAGRVASRAGPRATLARRVGAWRGGDAESGASARARWAPSRRLPPSSSALPRWSAAGCVPAGGPTLAAGVAVRLGRPCACTCLALPLGAYPRLVCRQGPPDFESGLAT